MMVTVDGEEFLIPLQYAFGGLGSVTHVSFHPAHMYPPFVMGGYPPSVFPVQAVATESNHVLKEDIHSISQIAFVSSRGSGPR